MAGQEEYTISFQNIFVPQSEKLSIEQFGDFLESVVAKTFKGAEYSPHELTPVVEDGAIHWLDVLQAEAVLHRKVNTQKETIKSSVRSSLKNHPKILGKELKVLVVLAFSTLKRYKSKYQIPEGEINRAKAQLDRVSHQVSNLLKELRIREERIQETRDKTPFIQEFEQKMAELLNLQKEGRTDEATQLAIELTRSKKRYLVLSRGLSTDIAAGNRLRLKLENQKRIVLNWRLHLIAQRESILREEQRNLRKAAENLKQILTQKDEINKEEYQKKTDCLRTTNGKESEGIKRSSNGTGHSKAKRKRNRNGFNPDPRDHWRNRQRRND